MPTILRFLPFYQENTSLRIPGGPALVVRDHQILVWISVAPAVCLELPANHPRIPALLDLGFNAEFLLREDHIRDWLKTPWAETDYPMVGNATVHGRSTPVFQANFWIHPNVPGFRDQFTDARPHRMELDVGIVVCPTDMPQFHLPLIGVSALRKNRLRLLVNGARKYISLRTPFERAMD